MKRVPGLTCACFSVLMLAGALVVARPAEARKLGVEVWTDRGNDAVYQPGDVLQVRVRTTEDSYLMVYEIDSEGYVRLLYPLRGQNGMVNARDTYDVPPRDDEQQLVVQDPTGEDFIVAIASPHPFENMPWYLRPYDVQGDNVGYVNQPDENEDQEGVTSEGKIVGDPFVAMERIRRRVLQTPLDASSFATAYTTYYVHEQVRYPRYICNDCHRPGRWAWWDGWDPYYTHCSAVDFRVNWSWGWGPTYWCGFVPYYVYVYRPECPPRWRTGGNVWYSSWDGWRRWNQLWGGPLTRYKSPPPQGYMPPTQWRDWRTGRNAPPPGFVVSGMRRQNGVNPMPVGTSRTIDDRMQRRPDLNRQPLDQGRNDNGVRVDRRERGGDARDPEVRRMPARPWGGDNGGREARDGGRSGPQERPQREPAHYAPPRSERGQQRQEGRSQHSHEDGGGRQSRGENRGHRGDDGGGNRGGERGGRGGP